MSSNRTGSDAWKASCRTRPLCFVDPFYDDPTLSLFCDIIDSVGHKPYDREVSHL